MKRRAGLLTAAIVGTLLCGPTPLRAEISLILPAGYVQGIPVLCRVEVRDKSGARDWSLWDAEAFLAADQPGVRLSTNRVVLRNGLGTALITIAGSAAFALTARVNGEQATRAIRDLAGQSVTFVSGTLTGPSTTWSGIVNVTGDLTVPAGHTLTIQPNTLVLIRGVASGTAGTVISVNGAIQSLGTEQQPVTITASDPALNWGQIRHGGTQPSLYQYTLISKAGRAPGEGHTGTGPALRLNNTLVTFEGCVISDLTAGGSTLGKIMSASGSTLVIRDCVLTRARMGPEIAGTSLLCTNSYFLEMSGPDDCDGIYLHSASGRSITLSGCVLAAGDDDAVDTLDSNVTVENCILRDWPNPNEDAKGVSAFNGEVNLRRCLIVNCTAGVSTKSSGPLATVRMDHCTVVGILQGVCAATKSNASAGNINIYLTHSIVRAPDALYSDFGPDKFVSVTYCNLSEPWPGSGNFTADPLFLNAAAGDYRLAPGSPCIDAGDPNSSLDGDGSRTELGFYSAQSTSGVFSAFLTAPVPGAIFVAPTNILIAATANSPTGTVARVEFYEGARRLGEDTTSPYSLAWNNVGQGEYTLRALASLVGGVTATSPPVTISVRPREGPSTNTLVAAGSDWKYLDDGSNQGTAWTQLVFNDRAWKSGKAQLGYGDGDEVTTLGYGPNASSKFVTYYFRRTFQIEDAARVRSLRLNLLRDDGAIVFLNGREAYRVSMPTGSVNYQTFATAASEYDWESTSLATDLLVTGTNIVAVEVHQGNATSTDLSFDLALEAVLSAPANAKPIVAITSPADHSTLAALAELTVSANALDPDGAVTSVAFFADGLKLGEDATSPYSLLWKNPSPGEHVLTAVATDAAGLTGTSSVVSVTVSTNIAPPRITSLTLLPGKVTNLAEVTIVFSKEVVGVDASDLQIDGVPASEISGSGSRYTFAFASLAPGPKTVRWSASHGITDTFTPPQPLDQNAAEASWQYTLVDSVPPTVKNVSPAVNTSVPALTNITVTFSESVTGLKASDLLINSQAAKSVSGSGAGPYTFVFPEPPPGRVSVAWSSAQTIQDQGGNPFSGGAWSYLYDISRADLVISEIMYHPASQNWREKYIELFNRGSSAVGLQGWRLRQAVDFSFPDVTIAAGGFLVVAADLPTFSSKYPSVTNVVGNWAGSLSNNREEIILEDARGNRIDRVTYANEGDWAVRQRGPLDRGHRGWVWSALHDGLGRSVELINPSVANDNGQNWTSSLVRDGTPGRLNSVFANHIAPLIEHVAHSPIVPKSTEPVRVTARVSPELGLEVTVSLFCRVDAATPGPFQAVPMTDDGQNGDVTAGDGVFSAVLPAQPNNAVVEFYLTASDSRKTERTWPAIADGTSGPPPANALYQVDDTDYTGTQPLYKIILTETERLELQAIGNNVGGSANSNSQMNGTFISIDGTGTECRYLIGVRNRGHGTRTAKPNNYRFNFRSDEKWKGVSALNINAQYSWLQVLGATLNLHAGSLGAYSRAVQVRVNNANLAFVNGTERTYGSYAANEVFNADWADRHFPEDGEGNGYRALRDLTPSDFDYRTQAAYPSLRGPENKNSYTNTWFKTTNAAEDDWTDLIAMLRVFGLNGTEAFTPENVRRVINVEQWMRHLAMMNLLGNSETGLNSGYNDDYSMYRGNQDRRLILLFYDQDQILGYNGGFGATAGLFSAANTGGTQRSGQAFDRFLRRPEFQSIYYATLRELVETTLSAAEFNAVVDQTLGDFVPETTRTQLKNWMASRRTYVLSQLPAVSLAKEPRAELSGGPRSPTTRATASFTVGGAGVTQYSFSLNGGIFSPEVSSSVPISLSALPNGTNRLDVIGGNSLGTFQSEADPTTVVWVVNTDWPTVRLNEVLAARSGNLPDQIELFNEGAAPVNLSGMQLTDDPAKPGKFVFGNAILEPGAYLVLDATRLGFALDASGEKLCLFNSVSAGGNLLDSVEFGPQIVDLSIGRVGENGEWQLTQPTFSSANVAQPLGDPAQVKINEWLTSGVSPYPSDFVELFNPGSLPVAIGGCSLTDQPVGAPRRSPIVPLSFVPAKGCLALSTGSGNPATQINFNLSSEQGEIGLLASDRTLIDSVIYGPQRRGVAVGRCPDGEPVQKPLATPTPGAPNQCPFVAAPPGEVTLISYAQVWRYDASGNDLGTAWKEPAYDDSSWPAGPGLLGFETAALVEPIRTTLTGGTNKITFYFRTRFVVGPAISPSALQITHLIDDGAAFYLNGQEIGSRYNLPAGAASQTFATASVEATPQTLSIPPSQLRPGTNLFAAEVHQINRTSSDLVFGLRMFGLVATNSPARAGILINEVLANNASLIEPDGSAPDWIELYNPSSNTVDVAGMSLSDQVSEPRRWTFPKGSLVPGKGFLRVYCDPNTPATGANTGFGLKANGGALYLFNSPSEGGGLQSAVTYGLQAPDWSVGRLPDGGTNWVLNIPSPGMANLRATLGNPRLLKINEWLADPAAGEDWFEIFNPNPEPVPLTGLYLSDLLGEPSKQALPPLSFIGNGVHAFQTFLADGNVTAGADHVAFKLSASGESLVISGAGGAVIDTVTFGAQATGVSQGRLPDGSATLVNFASSPTPGASNFLPLESVVINEVLSHTDPPLEDAVELHNTTSQAIDISGWFLSDSTVNLRKYQLPPNSVVPPGGFLVFYESAFNSDAAAEPFSFNSSRGDEVHLSQSSNSVLTGYRTYRTFGPSENGVSFGRYRTSQAVHFVPLAQRTFGRDNPATTNEFTLGKGAPNSPPKVGPVVVSEIMYHPAITNDALEFVELHNLSARSVPLYDPANPAKTWRLRKGVSFDFPPGMNLPPGGYLVVVSFNPQSDAAALTAFQAAYGAKPSLVGPYSGKLNNSTDAIELQKPDPPQTVPGPDFGWVPYLMVDRIDYADVLPWPASADGSGHSLQKIQLSLYGNDPVNWQAAAPNPGSGPAVVGDSDRDGLPDDWEIANGLNPSDPSDAGADSDRDGLSNLQEYLAGTDPRNAGSVFKAELSVNPQRQIVLTFQALANRAYTIEFQESLIAGVWQSLTEIAPVGSDRILQVPIDTSSGTRFFRLVTSGSP